VGRLRPQWIPRLMKIIPSASGRVEYVKPSQRTFVTPRLVHFYEMEYSVPRSACAPAIAAVREWIDRSGLQISFPIEVRFTAADDIPLSTAYGSERCYIAVHMYWGTPYEQYFRAVEAIMDGFDGRPHWGKLHFQQASTLAPRYPAWSGSRPCGAAPTPTAASPTPTSNASSARSDSRSAGLGSHGVRRGDGPGRAGVRIVDGDPEQPARRRLARVPEMPLEPVDFERGDRPVVQRAE